MKRLYSARWVLPISSPPISDGAIVINADRIVAVGERSSLIEEFPDAPEEKCGTAAILPGLINTHSHLELTAMRGFLDPEDLSFADWLRKLTAARLERMTSADLYVSAAWGACEAARAGITSVGDASDSASTSMRALIDVGLRGIVYQESFGPDARLLNENLGVLVAKVEGLKREETALVRAGVSPHSPYTVCPEQLEEIALLSIGENLPLMMHAAESAAEDSLLHEGRGLFADRFALRSIPWRTPGTSTIKYLERHGVLDTKPLLAHCIRVDDEDIAIIKAANASVAHCPKSNAKLGHGRAPITDFLAAGVTVGLGTDSVASNNTCDLLEEARFSVLLSRAAEGDVAGRHSLNAVVALQLATQGGAHAMGQESENGVLKPGSPADFIAVSLSGSHQLPVYDPCGALIFSSSGRDVVLTVVAGKEIYKNGRMLTVDEDDLRARVIDVAKRIQGTGE